MRTYTCLLLVAAVAVAWPADVRGQDILERNVPDAPTFAPGQVIVSMRTGTPMSAARLSVLGLDTAVRQLSGAVYIYRIPPATLGGLALGQAIERTLAVVDSLRASPDVEYAQPNYRLYIVGRAPPVHALQDVVPNDPRWVDQWHYHNNGTGSGESPGGISLPRAWDAGTGRGSVVVSILDTGILPNHPDISGSPNLVAGRDMISDPFIANDGGGRDADPTDPGDAVNAGECGGGQPPINLDDSWHGTHVAGTVGAVGSNNAVGIAGINHRVSIQPVRVLGKCGGLTSDIIDAIRWAAGLPVPGEPTNPTPARVINMSLGSPPGLSCAAAPAMQSAIDDAVAAGTAIAVAAGNDAAEAGQVVPASCNNVITVAASEARGHLASRYSNFGSTIEIMAPGGDVSRDDNGDGKPDGVLSTVQGGYEFYNGTSMATPHVAGVAALWLAQDPSLTTAGLLGELQAHALPRTSSQCPRPCGAGLLNAHRGAGATVTLALNPDKERYRVGDTATVTATVRQSGAPQPGRTVSFASDDSEVASVSPGSAGSDTAGEASVTLTAESRGEATVTATANGATATRVVRVPSLSDLALLLVVVAIGFATLFRRPRAASRNAGS